MTVNVGGKEVKRGEQKVAEEKKEEVKFNPADYWCDIILEKTTREKADDRSLPTDAFNVTYCLLYTSPSPRDRTRSRMPSSA